MKTTYRSNLVRAEMSTAVQHLSSDELTLVWELIRKQSLKRVYKALYRSLNFVLPVVMNASDEGKVNELPSEVQVGEPSFKWTYLFLPDFLDKSLTDFIDHCISFLTGTLFKSTFDLSATTYS